MIIGGRHQDQSPYVYFELLTGSWGGRPDRDGCDGLCHPLNVASNIPVEEAECAYPIRIDHYGLANDSGGPGKFRGGLAIEREWRLLHGKSNLSIRSDRRDHPPYGLYGGLPGKPSTNLLSHPNGAQELLPGFFSGFMSAGDHLYHRMPGAGGWGNPLERDPQLVYEDVLNEKVSIASAQEYYGVVIDPETLLFDEKTTRILRERRTTDLRKAKACAPTS